MTATRLADAAGENALGATRSTSEAIIDDSHESPLHTRPTWTRAVKVLAVCLALWWAPVFAAALWQGWDGGLAREGHSDGHEDACREETEDPTTQHAPKA